MRKAEGKTRGRLDDLSVAEIVQTLSLGLKTARVDLDAHGRSGTLWFERGDPRHATTDTLEGAEAFYEMVTWWSGGFVIQHGTSTPEVTIEEDATFLVMEGLRRLDEAGGVTEDTPEDPRPKRRRPVTVLVATAVAALGSLGWIGARALRTPGPEMVVSHRSVVLPLESRVGPATVDPGSEIPASEPAAEVVAAESTAPEPVAPPPVVEPTPRVAAKSFLASRTSVPAGEAEPNWASVVPVKPALEPGHLDLTVRSAVRGGTLELLVDGEATFTGELSTRRSIRRMLGRATVLEKRITIPAGSRDLLFRVTRTDGTTQDTSTTLEIEPDGSQAIRLLVGRPTQPLALKIDPDPALVARSTASGG
jgi:hypothetical protein